jgi:hypothetical protein
MSVARRDWASVGYSMSGLEPAQLARADRSPRRWQIHDRWRGRAIDL